MNISGTTTAGGDLDYSNRLATILEADDSKLALIKDLLQEYERQSQQLRRLELQLEDERETTEKWRGRYSEIAKETEKLTLNPYVAILLDGDGMIFTEPYLLHAHGGQNAATDLLQATRNHLRKTGLFGGNESFEIVVRAFANVTGVAEILRSRGLPTAFRQFTVGFSQPKPLVDFIDVGRGKEMADAKIAGEIRFHLSNYNCKLVILGVSHDNGYVRILSSLLAGGEEQGRLMLLEGVPFGREFYSLPFPRVKWGDLFLSKKLDNWVPDFVVRQQQQKQQREAKASKDKPSMDRAPTPQVPNSSHSQNIPPPPYEDLPRSGNQQARPWPYPPPVPRPAPGVLQRIQSINPSPCWKHYLGHGPGAACPNPDRCGHTHTPVFTPEELSALKFIAQGNRCAQGPKCKNPHCYFGHRCQVLGVCTGKNCPFTPEEHDEGMYRPPPPPPPGQQRHKKAGGRPASPVASTRAQSTNSAGVPPATGQDSIPAQEDKPEASKTPARGRNRNQRAKKPQKEGNASTGTAETVASNP